MKGIVLCSEYEMAEISIWKISSEHIWVVSHLDSNMQDKHDDYIIL